MCGFCIKNFFVLSYFLKLNFREGESMATKVAIIYYSQTGTTYKLAQAIEEGAKEAGAETRLLKVKETAPDSVIDRNEGWKKQRDETKDVREASNDDLEWADAIIFGTPTRYGLPSAQLKNFIDQTGGLWARGALTNKVGSAFTSTATAHGGQEATILAMLTPFYHWNMLVVSPGYADPIQFQAGNPYGASFTSNNAQLDPDETHLQAARFQGKRVAEVTTQFLNGKQ
jgi:NAD(P)H dehydrogenase (quinone)